MDEIRYMHDKDSGGKREEKTLSVTTNFYLRDEFSSYFRMVFLEILPRTFHSLIGNARKPRESVCFCLRWCVLTTLSLPI